MIIRFITSSSHKLTEARRLVGRQLDHLDLDLPEIQARTIDQIVLDKLDLAASRVSGGAVVVEDVGLGLDAAGGFPGPYVKWLLELAGGEALGAFARGLGANQATATCVVGLAIDGRREIFEGSVRGTIADEPRGNSGFGWDPWFVPEGSDRTFGEMSSEEKDRVSHRARAWKKLADYLRSR